MADHNAVIEGLSHSEERWLRSWGERHSAGAADATAPSEAAQAVAVASDTSRSPSGHQRGHWIPRGSLGRIVGDLFKSIASGFSRFVFAWMVPSALTLGLFWIFVLPSVTDLWFFQRIAATGRGDATTSGIVFAFFVLLLSVLFAYTSLPLYRLLEGYTLPGPLKRYLLRRQLKRWASLKEMERRSRLPGGRPVPPLMLEALRAYPESRHDVRPTRLGNALTAMERFGVSRYWLDNMSLWYELQAVVPEQTRRHTEEGRAPVDFFMSLFAHLLLFGTSCIAVFLRMHDTRLLWLGLAALALLPLSYSQAVRNVKDWGHSVKALVNLGRRPLAAQLGLRMPQELEGERNMWAAYSSVIEQGDERDIAYYDHYRLPSPPPTGG